MIYAGADDKQSQPSERWWEIEMVGGSTMVWDANFPRYADEDMAITQYLDIASIPNNNVVDMPDWPWSYDDMQPWFEIAEHEWAVSGKSGQTIGVKGAKPWSQERTRAGYDYPQPPLVDHSSTKFLMSTFAKAGMPAYRGPRAINSRTFDGRPACSFCGKIQYPEETLKKRMPVEQALAAIEESGAPMVSIAGGEPSPPVLVKADRPPAAI